MMFENWSIEDLFARCTDYDDMSLSMDKDEFAALRRMIAMLKAEPVSQPYMLPQWIPCSERLPELDTRVLLYFASCGGHIEDGCIGDEGDGSYHYFFDGDSLMTEPTHWMPLPAAPQEPTK